MNQVLKHRPSSSGREVLPLPLGEMVYDSLNTEFVNLSGVFHELAKNGFSGYVRLLAEGAWGVCLWSRGHAVEAILDDGQATLHGQDAAVAFAQTAQEGGGVVDISELPASLIEGVVALSSSRDLYTDLSCEWVDLNRLLESLAAKGFTGAVTVRSSGLTGFVLFDKGNMACAYTTGMRDAGDDVAPVLEMGEDAEALVDVKMAIEGSRSDLDLEDALGEPTATATPTSSAWSPIADTTHSEVGDPVPATSPMTEEAVASWQQYSSSPPVQPLPQVGQPPSEPSWLASPLAPTTSSAPVVPSLPPSAPAFSSQSPTPPDSTLPNDQVSAWDLPVNSDWSAAPVAEQVPTWWDPNADPSAPGSPVPLPSAPTSSWDAVPPAWATPQIPQSPTSPAAQDQSGEPQTDPPTEETVRLPDWMKPGQPPDGKDGKDEKPKGWGNE